MSRRLLGVLLAPALLVLAVVVIPSPAQAATACVTKGEYGRVSKGMTYTQVERRFGAHHVDASSGGAGAVVWTYRSCDARYLVKVTYVVPEHGAGTLYAKKRVAAQS